MNIKVAVLSVMLSITSDQSCFVSVGSLASSIFDPLKSLVGASGGVYALMGGYFMNVLVVRISGMESVSSGFVFRVAAGSGSLH